jgi:hypothetical protein
MSEDIKMMTQELIAEIKHEYQQAAANAAFDLLKSWYDGEDEGACGFAWVTIIPKNKGNTKAGRYERTFYESLGANKDWTGKAYQIWNPSKTYAQNIDCKEAGARAAAQVLQKHGIDCYADSRLD